MNCCPNCFNDKELKGFIYSNHSRKGNCSFCKSKNVEIIDCRELEATFLPIVSIYEQVVGATGQPLHEQIQIDWNLFNKANSKKLLLNIFKDSTFKNNKIFKNPIVLKTSKSKSSSKSDQEKRWNEFTEEIKHQNRFFISKNLDLNLLERLINFLSKTYSKGKIFYRGRISKEIGFKNHEMGKPTPKYSSAGRANPKGIPYLYVSLNLETTIHECRASHNDFITIGQFKATKDLKLISLKDITSVSPVILGDHIEDFIIHKNYLLRLEKELSKPVYETEADFDYLPTQYLCEFIKSKGYQAVEYSSSLKSDGINIAIFEDTGIICSKVNVYQIKSINYGKQKIL